MKHERVRVTMNRYGDHVQNCGIQIAGSLEQRELWIYEPVVSCEAIRGRKKESKKAKIYREKYGR